MLGGAEQADDVASWTSPSRPDNFAARMTREYEDETSAPTTASGKSGWSYAAAFAGAGLGGLVGAAAGWVLGAGLATLSGTDGFEALGFAIGGLLGGLPLGVCAGYWNALALAGRRPRPASMGLLVGLLMVAFVFRVLIDNAAWAQALFDWLGPFGVGHALVGVVVIPGLFGLLAHGLGDD